VFPVIGNKEQKFTIALSCGSKLSETVFPEQSINVNVSVVVPVLTIPVTLQVVKQFKIRGEASNFAILINN
jgi:hypothetical protein